MKDEPESGLGSVFRLSPSPAGKPGTQDVMNGEPLRHKVFITNPQGLHMRPSAAFAEVARRFQSAVNVSLGNRTVNGKSPLDLMLLVAMPGSELILEIDGPDAAAALEALVAVLKTIAEEEKA